jgi:hypothetical protein
MIISERDDKWMQDLMAKLFQEKDPLTLSLDEFMGVLTRYLATIDPNLAKRSVLGSTWGPDGTFDDVALIKIITESTEDKAGFTPFSPQLLSLVHGIHVLTLASFDCGIPKIMCIIEILGINQSHYWKTATFNEFCAFFGLPKYTKFEEMTSDPKKLRRFATFTDISIIWPSSDNGECVPKRDGDGD